MTAAEIRALSPEEFDKLLQAGIEEERRVGAANLSRADRTRWCECGDERVYQDGPEPVEASYYHDPATGRHGWFHDPEKGGCGGVTQTG